MTNLALGVSFVLNHLRCKKLAAHQIAGPCPPIFSCITLYFYGKAHSFRVGATSHAAEQGCSDAQIRMLGHRKSNAFQRYIRIPILCFYFRMHCLNVFESFLVEYS